uniref:Extracellular solute-binding protein n=1 Tax=Eubacterium plexicaudatum ASF492 TaxID=1235802 RepID=N2AH82_9FIRM
MMINVRWIRDIYGGNKGRGGVRRTGRKKRLLCMLGTLFVLLAAGCGRSNPKITHTQKDQTVKIPITFLIDAATGKRENEDLVRAFNEAYEGIYEADVEWLAITAGEYRSNLKRWNVADELPAIITDVCFSPAFYELMLADGRLVDLAPFIDEDPEWKDAFEKDVLDTCREEDASLYICPTASN